MRANYCLNRQVICLIIISTFSLSVHSLESHNSLVNFTENANDGLVNFLTDMMRNYTTWLTDNNLDPSTPIKNEFELKNPEGGKIALTCRITNLHTIGSSNEDGDRSSVAGNLTAKYFMIDHHTSIKFAGDYIINGAITEKDGHIIAFHSFGKFNLAPQKIYNEMSAYVNFQTPNGFIDLASASSDYLFEGHFHYVEFPELIQAMAKYEPLIKQELATLFENFLRGDGKLHNPARQLLHRYLEYVFEETSVEDIAAWPNSTLATTSTTQPPATTTTPRAAGGKVAANLWLLLPILAVMQF